MPDDVQPLLPSRSQRYEDYEAYGLNRLDYKLAELLNGDHPIVGTREVKVIQLAELEVLYDATVAAGWARHTGDWDWAVFVTTTEGELPGEGYNVHIKLPDNMPKDDFTACVDYDKVTHVVIDGYHVWDSTNDEHPTVPEHDHELPIDSITNIRWEQR